MDFSNEEISRRAQEWRHLYQPKCIFCGSDSFTTEGMYFSPCFEKNEARLDRGAPVVLLVCVGCGNVTSILASALQLSKPDNPLKRETHGKPES